MMEMLRVDLRDDRDVVLARQRARRVAELVGFAGQDQVRISTAVSEIARNALIHGGGGRVEFHATGENERELVVLVVDHGRGIDDLQAILDGRRGAGAGLLAARRAMDRFDVATSCQGTTITLGKSLARSAQPLHAGAIEQARQALALEEPRSIYQEFTAQNQDLMRALEDLRKNQAKLAQVNAELEETNRGVVALYADLEEKAASLERLGQQKSRFYSSMSHEFRTPVNSILSISQILLDRLDGELTPEQGRQVTLIQKSAKNLLEWITDLLDIAKLEAGKWDVKPAEFRVGELLSSLRGVMRPLVSNPAVQLVIEGPAEDIVGFSDEGKLSQILRNLVSNAIKFTEVGEICVRAEVLGEGRDLRIAVADTGIGIPPQFHEQLFEEFVQVENPLQKQARGTGLGLSLSKRLSELLGGTITVASEPGRGSTFVVQIPRVLGSENSADPQWAPAADVAPAVESRPQARPLVLIIDDDEASRYIARLELIKQSIDVAEAPTGGQGLALARSLRPQAIVLDLAMPDMDGFAVFAALREHDATRQIPIILRTSKPFDWIDHDRLPGAADIISKHPESGPVQLQRALRRMGLSSAVTSDASC